MYYYLIIWNIFTFIILRSLAVFFFFLMFLAVVKMTSELRYKQTKIKKYKKKKKKGGGKQNSLGPRYKWIIQSRLDQVFKKKKKKKKKKKSFAVDRFLPFQTTVKSKKIDKERKVTVIPIAVGALGTVPRTWKRDCMNWWLDKKKKKIETIQTTPLLKSARILKVL